MLNQALLDVDLDSVEWTRDKLENEVDSLRRRLHDLKLEHETTLHNVNLCKKEIEYLKSDAAFADEMLKLKTLNKTKIDDEANKSMKELCKIRDSLHNIRNEFSEIDSIKPNQQKIIVNNIFDNRYKKVIKNIIKDHISNIAISECNAVFKSLNDLNQEPHMRGLVNSVSTYFQKLKDKIISSPIIDLMAEEIVNHIRDRVCENLDKLNYEPLSDSDLCEITNLEAQIADSFSRIENFTKPTEELRHSPNAT